MFDLITSKQLCLGVTVSLENNRIWVRGNAEGRGFILCKHSSLIAQQAAMPQSI